MPLSLILPLDPGDRKFSQRLEASIVEELYRQSPSTLAAIMIPLLMIRVSVDAALTLSRWASMAFLAIAVMVFLRLAWLFLLARRSGLTPSVRVRHLAFIAGAGLTGLGFAALTLALFPLLEPVPLSLFCICLAGISASAAVTMASSPLAALTYLVPIVSSIILAGLLHPLPTLMPMFILVLLVFLFTLVTICFSVHRSQANNILLRLKLADMALRDSLTGLRNRHYLEEFLEDELARILRTWHPGSISAGVPIRSAAIVMMDLDHFKAVNDTHGHPAGDEVLRQAARILQENIRKPDLAVRWGGEEFLIFIRDTLQARPGMAAERVRSAIDRHAFRLPSGETIHLTCSLGYASFPFLQGSPDRLGWSQVMTLADEALYLAKRSGRNCTIGLHADAEESELATILEDPELGIQAALSRGWIRPREAEPLPKT